MSTRPGLRTILQRLFLVVAVVFIIVVVVKNWDALVGAISYMDARWLLAAGAAGVVAVSLSMMSWRAVAIAFGHRITVRQSSALVFISQIGKYIPGGVWPIVAGSQLGARAGIPASTTAVTLLTQLVISVATGSVMAVLLAFTVPAFAAQYVGLLVLVVLAGVVLLTPPVMIRWLRLIFRLIRRTHLVPEALSGRALASATAWSLASWVVFGLHLWFVLAATSGPAPELLLRSISGFSIAWVIGFLAIIAPAGAGVREAIMAVVLAGFFTAPQVLGIVLVSRMLLLAVDVVLFAAASIASRLSPTPPSEALPPAA